MAHNDSYDDIVRRTVPEPDSSFRPTRTQEQQAREGYRALDADEEALQSRVHSALQSEPGADLSNVTVEIDRSTVSLRGRVADGAALGKVEDAIARVEGVETIHNEIVIG